MNGTTRLFFATDIHASTRCFKKFLNAGRFYRADVIVLGGDVTGKVLVPIVRDGRGGMRAYDHGREIRLGSTAEIEAFEAKLADAGSYSYRCDREEFQALSEDGAHVEKLFSQLIRTRMEEWVALADTRLAGTEIRAFLNAGNDDAFEVDPIIDSSRTLVRPEGKVVEIDAFCSMISTGFANLTPFSCPRDIAEEELAQKITQMADRVPDLGRCIFNLHCPPFGSQLDNAPKLGDSLRPRMTAFGVEHAPAGSTAVRKAIENYQPLLGLHGHIHESRAAVRIDRTLCINPGSEYHEGVLRGALVELQRGSLVNYTLTCG